MVSMFETEKVALVLAEQTFWIGDNAEIEVVVNLYEYNDVYKITSWLGGIEELNTAEYTGSLSDETEIITAMEELINSNTNYILSVASEED